MKKKADMHGDKKKEDDEAEAGCLQRLKEALEKKKKDKEAKADEDEAEAELYEEDFKKVETSEAALVETEVEDEMETTRASVANWFEITYLTSNLTGDLNHGS